MQLGRGPDGKNKKKKNRKHKNRIYVDEDDFETENKKKTNWLPQDESYFCGPPSMYFYPVSILFFISI